VWVCDPNWYSLELRGIALGLDDIFNVDRNERHNIQILEHCAPIVVYIY